jgi:hypothetical protein
MAIEGIRMTDWKWNKAGQKYFWGALRIWIQRQKRPSPRSESLQRWAFHFIRTSASAAVLDVEFEEEDVAILDYIFFAFGTEKACFFNSLLAAVLEEVVGGVAISLDEAALEVGVDDSSSSRGFSAALDGPGADLLHTSREVGDEVEQTVGGVNEAVEAGLAEAHVLQELVTLGRFKLGDLGFHGSADADDLGAFFLGSLLYGGGVGIAVYKCSFIDVGDVELGLGGDEEELAREDALVVGEVGGSGRLACIENS